MVHGMFRVSEFANWHVGYHHTVLILPSVRLLLLLSGKLYTNIHIYMTTVMERYFPHMQIEYKYYMRPHATLHDAMIDRNLCKINMSYGHTYTDATLRVRDVYLC